MSIDLTDHTERMREAAAHKAQGVTHFIFGDTALTDLKAHREQQFHPLGIEVAAPLWHKSSAEVIQDFLASGIKAKIIVTQADQLGAVILGIMTLHTRPKR